MTLLPMENRESILSALKCFEKDKPSNVPPILDDYIKQVARNGQTMLPWIFIKPLILYKFNKVVDSLIAESNTSEFLQLPHNVNELRQCVYNTLKSLDGIPFTIQRMCELFESPFRHYSRPDKFLRGFEKVCMVVSTVDPQGNKILREDPRFPSRAGLDKCDNEIGDSLLSPPASPCVDDLHRQQTSKSSDSDEMTEDDDNEDEDDNHTETNSSTSPVDSSALNHPLLTDASVSGTWPFASSILGVATIQKVEFHDLSSGGSPSTDRIPTHYPSVRILSSEPTDRVLVGEADMTESSYRKPSVTEDVTPVISAADQPHDEALLTDGFVIRSNDDRTSSPTLTNMPKGPVDNNAPEVADNLAADENVVGATPPSGSRGAATVDEPNKSSKIAVEPVPSIDQMLRPIGQLEAFVQNMGVSVSCSTSLPSLLIPVTSDDASLKHEPEVSSHTTEDSSSPLSEVPTDTGLRITPRCKRRSVSPMVQGIDVSTLDVSDTDPGAGLTGSVYHSPAKRPRLMDVSPSSPTSDSKTGLPDTLSSTLNDSPPIILCNPDGQSRDRDSGERTSVIVHHQFITPITDSNDIDNHDGYATQDRDTPDQTTVETMDSLTHPHIDSETGEEEL